VVEVEADVVLVEAAEVEDDAVLALVGEGEIPVRAARVLRQRDLVREELAGVEEGVDLVVGPARIDVVLKALEDRVLLALTDRHGNAVVVHVLPGRVLLPVVIPRPVDLAAERVRPDLRADDDAGGALRKTRATLRPDLDDAVRRA
jgi:hypothetical protein